MVEVTNFSNNEGYNFFFLDVNPVDITGPFELR